MGGHRGAQRGHELAVAPLRKLRLGEVLGGSGAQLTEPLPFNRGGVVVWQLGQRRAANECERALQLGLSGERVAAFELVAPGGHECLEAVGVDPGGSRAQLVAAAPRDERPVAKRSGAQARDVGPQHLDSVGWRARRPQHVDHAIGRHRLVAVQQQEREHGALLRAPEPDRAAVVPRRRRAEEPEPDHGSPA